MKNLFLKRLLKRKALYPVPILLFLLILLIFVKTELTLTAYSRLIPENIAVIRPEIDGILKEIHVREGDIVKKNQVIFRLLDDDINFEIKKLVAKIKKEEWELKRLVAGPLPQEIKILKSEVDAIDSKRIYLEKETDRIEKLWKQTASSEAEFDQIKNELLVTKARLLEKRNRLALLRMGERVEVVEAKRARVEELQAALSNLRNDLEKTYIKSPIHGIVTTEWMHLKMGSHIKRGQEICRIEAIDKLVIEIPISEKDIQFVNIGAKVEMRMGAFPDKTFYSEITNIAYKTIEEKSTHLRIYSVIPNEDRRIKSDMNCFVKVHCGQYRLGYVLFRGVIRFFKVEFWSLW